MPASCSLLLSPGATCDREEAQEGFYGRQPGLSSVFTRQVYSVEEIGMQGRRERALLSRAQAGVRQTGR